jgi:hypothetical protein
LQYEIRGVTVRGRDSAAGLILASHHGGLGTAPESLVWATVQAAGAFSLRKDPLSVLGPQDLDLSRGPGYELGRHLISARGEEILLWPGPHGALRLGRFDRAGGLLGVHAVSAIDGFLTISRVVAAANGHLVLVGNIGIRPMIVEIDMEGRKISQFSPCADGMMAVSAAIDADSSVVAACNEETASGETVWVDRVSRDGTISIKTSFPGRATDIVRGPDGSYLVLAARGTITDSEVFVKGLGSALTEHWTRSLAKNQRPAGVFRAAPTMTGDFIVVGTIDGGLWISRVKADGSDVWTEIHDIRNSTDPESVLEVGLAALQDNFVVAYTAFVVEGRQQRQVVRVIRFSAK